MFHLQDVTSCLDSFLQTHHVAQVFLHSDSSCWEIATQVTWLSTRYGAELWDWGLVGGVVMMIMSVVMMLMKGHYVQKGWCGSEKEIIHIL